jgi:hypothetical protein
MESLNEKKNIGNFNEYGHGFDTGFRSPPWLYIQPDNANEFTNRDNAWRNDITHINQTTRCGRSSELALPDILHYR